MRAANLLMLAQGFASVPTPLLPAFEAQLSEREEPLANVKPHEAACVQALANALQLTGAVSPHDFDGFAYSFRIPQISSEFDLLKVANDAVVNIELKAEQVGKDRIRHQLVRNSYYLGPLDRTVHEFTFVREPQALFELREDGSLAVVPIERLVEVLQSIGSAYEGQLESLFRASDYLVSPLNDTADFLAGRYFLTNHQEQIKANFLQACAGPEAPAYLVYGSSGTGKSLLLYDLARSLDAERPACVVHCGVLAPGHAALNQAQEAFDVVSAKGSERLNLRAYGAVLIDEAQRMWPSQLRSIATSTHELGIPLFLSLDRRQMLGQADQRQDSESIVRSAFPNTRVLRLSRRIRTNRGLTGFIRTLFDLRGHSSKVHTCHVKVAYAPDATCARQMVEAFCADGYEYIRLGIAEEGKLAIPGCHTTNEVVGQEFDRVAMALGPGFAPHGATTRDEVICREHVFQGLTRARSDLALVVYDNPALLERLLDILS